MEHRTSEQLARAVGAYFYYANMWSYHIDSLNTSHLAVKHNGEIWRIEWKDEFYIVSFDMGGNGHPFGAQDLQVVLTYAKRRLQEKALLWLRRLDSELPT